jgi:hypothetical protein
MTLKSLLNTWRHNIPLTATLEIRRISPINNAERDLVQIGTGGERLKLQGVGEDSIDVYIDIEVIGDPAMLRKFRFELGKHVGIVIRVID